MSPDDDDAVTLADGTRLGEVDPNGTPVEWRQGGSMEWRPGTALRIRDNGIPLVVIATPAGARDRELVVEIPPNFVRRRTT